MSQPGGSGFDPRALYSRVVAAPLGDGAGPHKVVIDVNLRFPGGRDAAARRVRELVALAVDRPDSTPVEGEGIDAARTAALVQYLVADLTPASVRELVRLDREPGGPGRAIYRIWPDFVARPLTNRSSATVKADAARASFVARGAEIVWAVVDSGIAGSHPHFDLHQNLKLPRPLRHRDYTGGGSPLTDDHGHGTHVAGIIAGELHATAGRPLTAVRAELDHNGDVDYVPEKVTAMSGDGARVHARELQGHRRHGQRLHQRDPHRAPGHPQGQRLRARHPHPRREPLRRLPVRPGVVRLRQEPAVRGGRAITVGSTHRDMPHRYGVSYFSSKGPTGDGRAKPDLVAPGERILSAAAGATLAKIIAKRDEPVALDYVEDSGTSMAAAHVSGLGAAFLSIRREFIGRPTALKEILNGSATDLGRTPPFQGHGLVDLMRAIQSV